MRANGMRVWPARNTKTVAVCGAILHHLREIMIPEAPLTKLEAQRRCLAEVPNAYAEAFKQACATEAKNVADIIGARGWEADTSLAGRPGRALADRAVDPLREQFPPS